MSTPARKPRGIPEITVIAILLLVGVTAVIAVLRGGTSPAPSIVHPNLVAILPFRVAGADSGLHYLREGMMDLLGAKLTDDDGPRAADPQTVMSAWRRTAGSDTSDLPAATALALAGRLGAAATLAGDVSGPAKQITINASIASAPDGAVRATSSVVGPIDSLPALVDRLASELLGSAASHDGAPATRSADALRAYLTGRAAYRRAHYDAAARQLQRALVLDATLAQAALLLVFAQSRGAPLANSDRARQLAWAGRDRLNARERALLDAFVGPRFPEPPLHAEILVLTERAVDLGRDSPDAWYLLGDEYFHSGAYLGHVDWRSRARIAFERALELGSPFADPLGHLIELAIERGDTTEIRRLASLGDYPLITQWQVAHTLRDTVLAARVRQELDTATHTDELLFHALSGGAHNELAGMIAAFERRATTRDQRLAVHNQRVIIALNQGRVRAALATADSGGVLPPIEAAGLRVLAALFSRVNDSARTTASVRDLARFVVGPAATSEAAFMTQYSALSLLGQWAIVSGDATGAGRAAARLRSAPAEPVRTARYARVWAELLDGHAGALRGLRSARAHADQADSLLRLGPDLWRPAVENLVLALLYDALGDSRKALAAIRRRSPRGANFVESWFLREEGRLATKSGDRAGALAAYRSYVRMLSNPDPEVAATATAVQREISRLDRN